MKKKNVINQLLWTLSFITLLNSHNLAWASASCPKGYYCCEDCNDMQYVCCPNNNQSGPKIMSIPKVTAQDILNYAQGKNTSGWKALRLTGSSTQGIQIPSSIADIKVGEVTHLGDGRYQVDYMVKGVSHSAIITSVPEKESLKTSSREK